MQLNFKNSTAKKKNGDKIGSFADFKQHHSSRSKLLPLKKKKKKKDRKSHLADLGQNIYIFARLIEKMMHFGKQLKNIFNDHW